MSITGICLFVWTDGRSKPIATCMQARVSESAPGSRWSARSNARTNDLEAGASPRRMFQVVSGVVSDAL